MGASAWLIKKLARKTTMRKAGAACAQIAIFSFDELSMSIILLVRSAAASVFPKRSSLAQREPTFGAKPRSTVVAIRMGRLVFDSAILDFVITTIRLFEIQKVEVSEN